MKTTAATPDEYLSQIEDKSKADMVAMLRHTATENMPPGFAEQMSYGMITYVVPHSLYAPGYHCDPKLALPFVSIAAQKNFVALYHMGIYADPDLLHWFKTEYAARVKTKLDMGKSCIRFKKLQDIPLELIGELMKKMNPQQWISLYEKNLRR